MPTTGSGKWPYPNSSAVPDVPADILLLAQRIDLMSSGWTMTATTTTRTALVTNSNAYEGLTVYQIDTGATYRYTSSAWVLLYLPKTTYTPSYTSGFSVGNGTVTAWYQVINARVFYHIEIVAGSGTGWTSGNITPTVPLGTISGNTTDATQCVGICSYFDTSAGARFSGLVHNATSNGGLLPRGIGGNTTATTSWVGSATAGSNVPSGAVIATGDVITFDGSYLPA
jgi:hypothetical protein